MARTFLETALLILALIIGAYLWRHFVDKPRVTTRIEWYERPIVIPPKVESKLGTLGPFTPEEARRDTIINNAPCDSARDLAMHLARPFSATFTDTTAFADSLVQFSALEVTTIKVDPWTRIITKTREYRDAILKAARVTTTEEVTRIDWLVTAGAFILGVLVVLLFG